MVQVITWHSKTTQGGPAAILCRPSAQGQAGAWPPAQLSHGLQPRFQGYFTDSPIAPRGASRLPWHLKEGTPFPPWWKDWGKASSAYWMPVSALPPGALFPPHTQMLSTYLRSPVPPGWAGHESSAVVIALLREGPG